MPATPIRELILVDLVTTLTTMTAGTEYFHTPSLVGRKSISTETMEAAYTLQMVEGEETYEVAGASGATTPAGFTGCRLETSVVFQMTDVEADTVATLGNEILHDLHKAMMTRDEQQIGGVQVRINPLRSYKTVSEILDNRLEGSITFVVEYRHREGDPARPV